MTLDEVVKQSKTKADYTKAQELAKNVEEQTERASHLNSTGVAG
jgi:hypothetical protein